MSKIYYNKLIRDKIPDIISRSGKDYKTKILPSEEYLIKLEEKLTEEIDEYLSTGSIEELVDLVEVVYAILNHKGITLDRFEGMRKEKNQNRGGFDKKLLLEYVQSESNNE